MGKTKNTPADTHTTFSHIPDDSLDGAGARRGTGENIPLQRDENNERRVAKGTQTVRVSSSRGPRRSQTQPDKPSYR